MRAPSSDLRYFTSVVRDLVSALIPMHILVQKWSPVSWNNPSRYESVHKIFQGLHFCTIYNASGTLSYLRIIFTVGTELYMQSIASHTNRKMTVKIRRERASVKAYNIYRSEETNHLSGRSLILSLLYGLSVVLVMHVWERPWYEMVSHFCRGYC